MTRARDVANIDGVLTTTGDTYYASAAGTPARLGIGSTGQVAYCIWWVAYLGYC